MHVHAQPSPGNTFSAPEPFQLSSDLQTSSEFYVKEIDKIIVSQCDNSNVAVSGHASTLLDNESTTPMTQGHLTCSVEEFDEKKPGLTDVVLVYPNGSNEVLPDHASILPCSDNKWMAVEVELNKNEGHKYTPSTSCC